MPAPTVQALNDIVAQIQAAYQPQQQQIDASINQNDQSGQSQIAGIDAKKTQAFKTIDQNANNRGMYFSGYRPNEQATYTGSTYLPALAQLQGTIASTRNALLGKKADLTVQGNQQALTVQQQQQKDLLDYQNQQEQWANQAAEAEKQRQFEADQNERNRQAQAAAAAASAASKAAAKAPSAAELKQQDMSVTAQNLQSKIGNDGHVSQETWNRAINDWTAAGYPAADFVKNNIQYVNQRYGGYHGYN